MMTNAIIFGCIAVLVPCLDQLTKYLVRTFMEVGDTVPIIKDFFHITYSLNDGMAFGSMGGSGRWVFMIFTPIALAGVLVYLYHYRKTVDKLSVVALSMIFAGGLSNMIDRIFFIHLDPSSSGYFDGRVVDFLDFRGIWSAIFNVADSFVVVGVFLFLLAFILEEVRNGKKKKAQEAATEKMPENEATKEELPTPSMTSETNKNDRKEAASESVPPEQNGNADEK